MRSWKRHTLPWSFADGRVSEVVDKVGDFVLLADSHTVHGLELLVVPVALLRVEHFFHCASSPVVVVPDGHTHHGAGGQVTPRSYPSFIISAEFIFLLAERGSYVPALVAMLRRTPAEKPNTRESIRGMGLWKRIFTGVRNAFLRHLFLLLLFLSKLFHF